LTLRVGRASGRQRAVEHHNALPSPGGVPLRDIDACHEFVAAGIDDPPGVAIEPLCSSTLLAGTTVVPGALE
jgi:hypothetical protein